MHRGRRGLKRKISKAKSLREIQRTVRFTVCELVDDDNKDDDDEAEVD